ncbi:MAG: anthranilate phosphoribosyltransferase [Candidatus Omnitrophica bacterium]|nr:anthranilate phosphoribosyltransferase [Candidatus Omnitrophota bacterium]
MAFEQPLSAEEMRRVLGAIMEGRTPPEEIRAFLTTLAERGETAEELAAAVEVLRAHVVPLPLANPRDLCDTCGTGGDGQDTLNVSTLAALVAAAAGVRVVKHGNRAASSRCGSADLLEALGVNLEASPAVVARCVDELGFGFCFAPRFHPAMKAVAPIRKELKIRTIFNLIGPLANPAPLSFQLVGVAQARLLRPVAETLVRLGIRHGLVVRGADGLDEVTTTGPTDAVEVQADLLTGRRLEPEGLGLPRATLEALRGGDAAHNARLAREVLEGRPGPASDIVAANAGCAIYLAGLTRTIHDGVAQAHATLAGGRAASLLDRVKALSHAG